MPMPAELRALLQRYVRLGALIPPLDDFDDPNTRGDVELVLAEMALVQSEIDRFLIRPQ